MINEFRGKHYFLSNFYSAPVFYDGLFYTNNEAAFQSAKTLNKEKREIFTQLDPSKSKQKGRRIELRRDWEQVKDDIMYVICKDKFTRNEDLKQRLLETGKEELIEGNVWNDKYWGMCGGQGKNKLGKILMLIRKEISI